MAGLCSGHLSISTAGWTTVVLRTAFFSVYRIQMAYIDPSRWRAKESEDRLPDNRYRQTSLDEARQDEASRDDGREGEENHRLRGWSYTFAAIIVGHLVSRTIGIFC